MEVFVPGTVTSHVSSRRCGRSVSETSPAAARTVLPSRPTATCTRGAWASTGDLGTETTRHSCAQNRWVCCLSSFSFVFHDIALMLSYKKLSLSAFKTTYMHHVFNYIYVYVYIYI